LHLPLPAASLLPRMMQRRDESYMALN